MKKVENVGFVIFAIIGAIIIVAGAYFMKSFNDFKKTAVETSAVITNIERHRDSDGDINYTPIVRFEVNGQTYGGDLGYYTSGMQTGQKIDIL